MRHQDLIDYLYDLSAGVDKTPSTSGLDNMDEETKRLFIAWDKGDCSIQGAALVVAFHYIKQGVADRGSDAPDHWQAFLDLMREGV